MKCSKDEASKAKVVAEQKLTENDFAGAKEFALKAQALYPGMEGLSQLMTIINIYECAGEKVISGGREVDWYGILGVTRTDDDESVRKQYLKLALMIHPDKSKCIGADGAFNLVSEAWNLLSDKAKRYAYDQTRIHSFCNKNITNNDGSSSSCWNNVRPQPQNNTSVAPQATFLSDCLTCRMPYELSSIYRDKTIHCPRCLQPFKALLRDFKIGNHPLIPDPTWNIFAVQNTFLTHCLTCQTRYEVSNIYEDKTIRCLRCLQTFMAVVRVFRLGGNTSVALHDTFSTHCTTCQKPYELSRIYQDKTICCPRCLQPFKALLRDFKIGNHAWIPDPTWNIVALQNTFLTHCLPCQTRYELSNIYEDKTVRCLRCLQTFKAVVRAFRLGNCSLISDHNRNYYSPNDNSFSHPQSSNHVPPPPPPPRPCANACYPAPKRGGGIGGGLSANKFFPHLVSFGRMAAASVCPTGSATKAAANGIVQLQQEANNERMKRAHEEAQDYKERTERFHEKTQGEQQAKNERMKRAFWEEEAAAQGAAGGDWERRRVKVCTRAP